MPWDPDIYNQFKEKRREPFYDLIGHIQARPGMQILDLGCGTGELTGIVAERFQNAKILGIDNSAEMLAKAPVLANLSFAQRSVEDQLTIDEKWDLIIANASLQWVYNHAELFPKIISKLLPGGQLAVQMPSQKENQLNQILDELVHETPYFEVLKGVIRESPVLSLDDYTGILYSSGGKGVTVYLKVYPIIAQSAETLYNFISGSALVPYMEKLREPIKTQFTSEYKKRIASHFIAPPMVYAFKRIIMVANF